MFRRHYKKRSNNIIFVIFRLALSVVIFAVLLGGLYSAYKQFSGLDPLKLDPGAIFSELLAGRVPEGFLKTLSFSKATQELSEQINQKTLSQQRSKEIPSETSPEQPKIPKMVFKFLVVADSHSDNTNLSKALSQTKRDFPDLKFIIGLGDYTEVGTIQELKNAKKELDSSGLRYFLIPGDHDLWDCRNKNLVPTACFMEVFGPSYQSFTFNNFRFLLLNNSDNYQGIDSEQQEWITNELTKAREEGGSGILAFVHEPLYHPSSDHVMGWVEKSLKSQATNLIFQLKEAGVKKVFSGDIHYFSEYSEPQTTLAMVTVGAITIERNPQAPRFAVVSVFEDGSTEVEDVEIR